MTDELDKHKIHKPPGPPQFTEELRMRQETDGVLLESYLIYEQDHQATWYKDGVALLGALDFEEKYQPFLERRGDWTYCALAIRHLSQEDAGNYMVTVKNSYGEKSNHVRLSMKDENEPPKVPGGIEPSFFRKPTSRQEGANLLHLECEIEARPEPQITWCLNDQPLLPGDKYRMKQHRSGHNPNLHFVALSISNPSKEDGGNYVVTAVNAAGNKSCTLAVNFGGDADEENVPPRVYEQPQLHQMDGGTLVLEAHVHSNPAPKITWLRNGDFIKFSERILAKLEPRSGEKNKYNATLTIMNPSKDDAGDYKCSVKNKWGQTYTTFKLG